MVTTAAQSFEEHKSGNLPIALYPNRMNVAASARPSYYARLICRGTCTNEDIVNDIMTGGVNGDLSKEQLLRAAELLKNARLSRIADGYAVDDGISRMQACVTGSFNSATDTFSIERHAIGLSSRATAAAKEILSVLRPVIRQGNSTKPVITKVLDHESGRSDTLTRGGFLDIRGANIRIGGTAEEVGLYFTHTEDSGKDVKLTADKLGTNKASHIACVVPQALSEGCYRIKIVTQFINIRILRNEPMTFLLETPLTVA